MGYTISLETYKKRVKQEKTVDELNKQFQKYGLRLLMSYPDYRQVIQPANDKPQYCLYIKIREARRLLKALQKGINTRQVIEYITKHGEPYLK